MGGAEAKLQTWFTFLHAHRAATRALEADLTLTDLTPDGFELLTKLDVVPEAGLGAADLATALQVTRRHLDGVAGHLLRLGYVTRARDGRDRRITRIAITRSGRQALARATPVHLAGVHTHFLDGITQKEARALRVSMGKVLDLNGAARR